MEDRTALHVNFMIIKYVLSFNKLISNPILMSRGPEFGVTPGTIRRREIEKKRIEDREGLKWRGFDNSTDILPHLNLSWQEIEETYGESDKPVGDLGASFSTLAVEGQLRDVEVIPIDMMHDVNKIVYGDYIYQSFNRWQLEGIYQGSSQVPPYLKSRKHYSDMDGKYWKAVDKAMYEALKRYLHADLAHIPLKDRSLSISITHDSVPKHSKNFEEFLKEQLPEILRVTDRVAYVYPLSIFETIQRQRQATAAEHAEHWSDPGYKGMVWVDAIKEKRALYEDQDALNRIREVAERLGFEFELERGSEVRSDPGVIDYRTLRPEEQEKAMLGVFKRKS